MAIAYETIEHEDTGANILVCERQVGENYTPWRMLIVDIRTWGHNKITPNELADLGEWMIRQAKKIKELYGPSGKPKRAQGGPMNNSLGDVMFDAEARIHELQQDLVEANARIRDLAIGQAEIERLRYECTALKISHDSWLDHCVMEQETLADAEDARDRLAVVADALAVEVREIHGWAESVTLDCDDTEYRAERLETALRELVEAVEWMDECKGTQRFPDWRGADESEHRRYANRAQNAMPEMDATEEAAFRSRSAALTAAHEILGEKEPIP